MLTFSLPRTVLPASGSLTWYTALLTVGVFVFVAFYLRRTSRLGLPTSDTTALMWILVISASFGGPVLARAAGARNSFIAAALLAGGMGAAFAWVRRLPLWKLADAAAPGAAFGMAIAKLGCLTAGCCVGSPTRRGLAVIYSWTTPGPPPAVLTYAPHWAGVPLTPLPLYTALWALALGVVSLRRWKGGPGTVFLSLLTAFMAFRGGLEWIAPAFVGSEGRWVAARWNGLFTFTLGAGAALLLFLKRRTPRSPA